jgi:uncharacterized membrane protein
MISIGDLPGGSTSAAADDVSGDGSVIVGFGSSVNGTEAFRWTQATGMQRLWDVLVASGVNPANDGWTKLVEAYGISDDGNTIVGYGVRNGNNEAFLAVIPEPTMLAALALAATALITKRRRRALM